jgi:hypothetical protein
MKTQLKPPVIKTLEPTHSPEIELLLWCARTQINETIAEQIKTRLQQKLDWVKLIQLAFQHGLMPLLYWNLNAIAPEFVSPTILSQLRQHFQTSAQRNLLQTSELLRVLKILRTHSILAIPFKGPILATSIYNNLALRQFTDLDILVTDRDVEKVKALLISNGYQLEKELGWEYSFVHLTTQIKIDLHQTIAPKFFIFPIRFAQLWSHAQPIPLAGAKVKSFSPEDLLQTLCVQWGKDCCQKRMRMAQLCDVAELLRVYPHLNWFWILEQCRQLGTERMMLFTLFQVRDLLKVELPDIILDRIQDDPIVESLAAEVRSWLWAEIAPSPPKKKEDTFWTFLWFYQHRFYFKLRERNSDKIDYCRYWLQDFLYFAFAPNAQDRALIKLPRPLTFLYYPLHVIRLIKKHSLSLLTH